MLQGANGGRGRRRPSRAELEPAALALLQRHGAAIMATARRFAASPEDAEDAYQRGVEILLTKAPTTAEEELVPWLRTVVKHEAWALRRQRQRAAPVADDGEVPEPGSDPTHTHEQAERLERLRLGAEALGQLKPQEVRALLLKAEGYSYRQIQEITGWTYTKVNRCLTEGRKAFRERVAAIEAGSECEQLAPLLSRLADGEATAADLTALRPHLRTCLSCRESLREFRAAPRTAAALIPAAALAGGGTALADTPARVLEALAGWTQKAQGAVEMASAQKVAAVAASTAVIAGGGAAVTVKQAEQPTGKQDRAERRAPKRASGETPRPPVTPPAGVSPAAGSPAAHAPARPSRTAERERQARAEEARTPPAQQEFEPAWAAAEPAPSTATATATSTGTGSTGSARKPAATGGGGAEEFAP